MKKRYEAPEVGIELYELNAALAANCGSIVDDGPAMGNHTACEGYVDPTDTGDFHTMARMPAQQGPFYDDEKACDCYNTAVGVWTS